MAVDLIFHTNKDMINGNPYHIYPNGKVFLPSFLSASKYVKRQLFENSTAFSIGIFHQGIMFTIIGIDTWDNTKGRWLTQHGKFQFGLVDTNIGSTLSFTNHSELPKYFWDKAFLIMLEDACNQMVIQSIHGS